MIVFLSTWWGQVLVGMMLGVIAMLCHEFGHALAAIALGVRIKKVAVGWHGLYIVRQAGSEWQNLLISLAGPAVNALLCVLWRWHFYFSLANLCFAACNLLPISGSDGERALRCWSRVRNRDGQGGD